MRRPPRRPVERRVPTPAPVRVTVVLDEILVQRVDQLAVRLRTSRDRALVLALVRGLALDRRDPLLNVGLSHPASNIEGVHKGTNAGRGTG